MIPRKLYLDTSVIGGYFDNEFEEDTRKLWQLMQLGKYKFYTSDVTVREINKAPKNVQKLFKETFNDKDLFIVSDEVTYLSKKYVELGILKLTSIDDATHVAVASVSNIMVLVSWNFKHMVNLRNKEAFNGVNSLHGYPNIRIVSPKELIYE